MKAWFGDPGISLAASRGSLVGGFLGDVRDLIFPGECFLSGIALKKSMGRVGTFSSEAWEALPWIHAGHCRGCGRELNGQVSCPPEYCGECPPGRFRWGRAKSLWRYEGVPRDLIHHLKYRNAWYLSGSLVKGLQSRVDLEVFLRGAVLIPVPSHGWRRLLRGYGQAEKIAYLLREAFGLRVSLVLGKSRWTGSQTQLGRRERLKNVRDSMYLRKPPPAARMVVVDDTWTTGATVSEAVRALRTATREPIDILTLARG